VDPATGAERIVGTRRKGFVGTALSKDGTTILGYTNGASGDARLNQVATAGYTGGRISVLVGKSGYPDWTR
jgi:hypothetical protein